MCQEQIEKIIDRAKRKPESTQGYRVRGVDGDSVTLSSSTGGIGKGTGLYTVSQGYTVSGTDGPAKTILNHGGGIGSYTGCYAVDSPPRGDDVEARPMLNADKACCTAHGRRIKGRDEPEFTLTASDRHGAAVRPANPKMGLMEIDGVAYNVRRLTPKECFRLQGFPDELFDRAAAVNSDTQLYKQAGNAVTATVSYEIGKWIMEMEAENGQDD